MKKIIICLLIIFSLNYVFTSEFVKSDFRFFAVDSNNDEVTSASTDETTSASDDKFSKGLYATNIVHAVLGGVAYGGMLADCILGQIMLYSLYNGSLTASGNGENEDDSDSSTGASAKADSSTGATYNVQIAHRAVSISTYALMGTTMIMTFVTLGIKIKNHMPINRFHFASSIITTVLYLLEIPFIALTAYSYSTHGPYTKEISLAHGIYSYVLLASFTITLLAIPIGNGSRKPLF